ncbi:acyl carrier protein [Actinomadura monticuli]|uniref:Acyl carrier protein n=1 Tax=Actinomadura monticuli TaxID=3097367 RepID=A0ABV4Q4P6_9ACTN
MEELDRAAREEMIVDALAEYCRERVPEGREFRTDRPFFENGLTSRMLVEIVVLLRERGIPVSMLDFFRQRTVDRLAATLSDRLANT